MPDSDVEVSAVRISLSRIFTTYSSPEYACFVAGHIASSFFARASSLRSRSSISASSAVSAVWIALSSCTAASVSATRPLFCNGFS